jgi:hypothetical protein
MQNTFFLSKTKTKKTASYLGRLPSLLAQAGYDPDKIPEELHLDALHVAWAWASGLFDIDDVAHACELTYDEACDVRDALRIAARPGAVTA